MAISAKAHSLEPAHEIPSSFSASLKSWWRTGTKTSAASEQRILQRLPYYQSPSSENADHSPLLSHGVVARSSMVPLASKPNQFLNTLSFLPIKASERTSQHLPAVLLHGYGAGLCFFSRNFPTIGSWVASRNTPVHAVDWLGMGRSSRPPFKIHAKRDDVVARVTEAENFFVDSLEEWRQHMGLQKMTLIGHSLGAYLSAAYALRYPDRVGRLILLSPAGVPGDPNTEMPSREIDESPTDPIGQSDAATPVPASKGRISRLHAQQKQQKQEESRTRKLVTYLWEEGWSPFQIVRSSLFFGPMLVGRYSSRRFTGLTEEETRELHDYILNITVAKGSGEYSISHLLAPGAIARLPLVDRISSVNVPVTFVYGDHDWMDPEGGSKSVENLRKAGNKYCKVVVIPNAGHHVYLDNPRAVNELLVKELDSTRP